MKNRNQKSENDPNGLNVLVNKEYVCQVHLCEVNGTCCTLLHIHKIHLESITGSITEKRCSRVYIKTKREGS